MLLHTIYHRSCETQHYDAACVLLYADVRGLSLCRASKGPPPRVSEMIRKKDEIDK